MFPFDLSAREILALEFLSQTEVDKEWRWKILWTDEAHFHRTAYNNAQNCRIWETENPLKTQPHRFIVQSYCGVWVYGIIYHGVIFLEEMDTLAIVTVTAIGQRYEYLLRNHIIPALQ